MRLTLHDLRQGLFALVLGGCLAGLVYWVQHKEAERLKPLELDIAALSRDDLRTPLLARFPEHEFLCGMEASDLGETICHTEIDRFNGIPGRYFAFFFNHGGRLVAFKVAAYAPQHEVLKQAFTERFGPARALKDGAVLTWPTGQGLLSMNARARGPESTVLWIDDPEVVKSLSGQGEGEAEAADSP